MTYRPRITTSDGTAAGTRLPGAINTQPGAGAAELGDLTVVNSDPCFWCNDGTTGRALWIVSLIGGNPQPLALTSSYGEGCIGSGNLVPRIGACTAPMLGNFGFTLERARVRMRTAGVAASRS